MAWCVIACGNGYGANALSAGVGALSAGVGAVSIGGCGGTSAEVVSACWNKYILRKYIANEEQVEVCRWVPFQT